MSFSDFKEVTSNNAGSATRYGGNDLKEVMQVLNGKVVANRKVRILNEWVFNDHFDLTPPGVTPGNPSDTNASRMYADPSDFKIKVKKTTGTVVDIENLNIANTALNQITDKAKLHNAVVYNDQNNSLGAFWEDMAQISTPSNPASGIRRVFVNSANGELSVRTSAGATVSLETQAGGGGGDVLTTATNTYGDFDSIFRSSRVKIRNPANTFSYSLVGSAITAARNVTLPLLTADDTLATLAFAQTLTTKTINVDQNTIKDSTTNVAGDILKGDGTKFVRFAKGASNQFLTVNAGGTDLVWATPAGGGNVSTTGPNTYGDFDQIFRSGRLDVTNPANTFNYSITGSAITAARAATIPLLTADDTFVMAAFTQTLTNKTLTTPVISSISNTGTITLPTATDTLVGRATTDTLSNKTVNVDTSILKHSTTNAAGDILANNGTQFIRLARGAANQVLSVNAGGTDIAWAAPTGGGGATPREDIAAHWQEAMRFSANSTYANMIFCYDNAASTINEPLDNAIMNIDFTAKTQVRAQWAHRRNQDSASAGTSVDSIRVVDSTNAANVLFEVNSISTDTRQTVALSALPGWATGTKTLVPQAKKTTGSGVIWIGDLIIWLK